jgi:glycosyltransferase involved in cell wall biosynthesis
MKIAVYHNLEKGGAFNYLVQICKELSKEHKIDIYCHKKLVKKNKNIQEILFPLSKPKNLIEYLYQVFFELKSANKKISHDINSKKYDLVIIGQCLLTQTPYLVKYLNQELQTIYIFNEPKREFYEQTSYDHYYPKRTIARMLRIPVKLIDKINCSKAKTIVSNSIYSSFCLKKHYKKKSYVIYPGMKRTPTKQIIKVNNKMAMSIGAISYIKGHQFSTEQIRNSKAKLHILGRHTPESQKTLLISQRSGVELIIIKEESDSKKQKIMKNYSIYLANQIKEPFGIATLEAANQKMIILGTNEGGTPEVISPGINGFLYPRKERLAKALFLEIYKRHKIIVYRHNIINWKNTSDNFLILYHRLKNTPNE